MELFKANEASGKLKSKKTPFGTWNPTKSFAPFFEVDEVNKKWVVLEGALHNKINYVYNYSDIVSYEFLEDGESVVKGGIGSAVVGGVLFGGVGAVVGGLTGKKTSKKIVTNMAIKIITKAPEHLLVYVQFLRNTKTKTTSSVYTSYLQTADQILALLANMQAANTEQPVESHSAAVDEIRKYKELLDDGIITKEEFDSKKAQLLNI